MPHPLILDLDALGILTQVDGDMARTIRRVRVVPFDPNVAMTVPGCSKELPWTAEPCVHVAVRPTLLLAAWTNATPARFPRTG